MNYISELSDIFTKLHFTHEMLRTMFGLLVALFIIFAIIALVGSFGPDEAKFGENERGASATISVLSLLFGALSIMSGVLLFITMPQSMDGTVKAVQSGVESQLQQAYGETLELRGTGGQREDSYCLVGELTQNTHIQSECDSGSVMVTATIESGDNTYLYGVDVNHDGDVSLSKLPNTNAPDPNDLKVSQEEE